MKRAHLLVAAAVLGALVLLYNFTTDVLSSADSSDGSDNQYPPQTISHQQTITQDTHDFVALTRGKCTDKTQVHRYQELYARAFHVVRRTGAAVRLLEVGLGCLYGPCAAGGAKAFMRFLPLGKYHSLEIDVSVCKRKYATSGVGVALASYIDDHLCPGSSVDPDVIAVCNARFGPFDVVIDDGSHLHMHTTSAFRQWFGAPYLNPGGAYIVEDMQVATMPIYNADFEGPKSSSHPSALGATFMNYAQGIFFCKLAGVLCYAPKGGLPHHSMVAYAPLVSELVMARESTIVRKQRWAGIGNTKATAPAAFESQDVIVALSTEEQAVYAARANVLVLQRNATLPPPAATERFLQEKFPYGTVDVEAAIPSGTMRISECIALPTGNPSSCVQRTVSAMGSANTVVDLVWIETAADENPATWEDQRRVVDVVVALLESPLLKPHGVVAINGYQARRAAFEAALQRGASSSSSGDIREPILRFLFDLSTSMLCCSPSTTPQQFQKERDNLPYQAMYAQVSTTRKFVGDISVDNRGTVYIRKMHPRSL